MPEDEELLLWCGCWPPKWATSENDGGGDQLWSAGDARLDEGVLPASLADGDSELLLRLSRCLEPDRGRELKLLGILKGRGGGGGGLLVSLGSSPSA